MIARLRRLILFALLAAVFPVSASAAPAVTVSADGRTASIMLDVLTYNIEGVPRRSGRKRDLAQIGRHLDALRRAGAGPDVVLFQEAFSKNAKAAVRAAGYPATAAGPPRKQRRQLPRLGERPGRKWAKGELGLKLVGSGLAIASVYPISAQAGEPFSRRACAGLDCLSNKGGQFVRLAIPGVPFGVDIFNTHMNAQGASRVGASRNLPVHHAQVRELSAFMAEIGDADTPTILGGDFNMRRSEARFEVFEANQRLDLVHQYCLQHSNACDVRASWDDDAPWMDTQDLQLFGSGGRAQIRPVRVETLFDGRPDSPKLSDHDGFRVVYRISWTID